MRVILAQQCAGISQAKRLLIVLYQETDRSKRTHQTIQHGWISVDLFSHRRRSRWLIRKLIEHTKRSARIQGLATPATKDQIKHQFGCVSPRRGKEAAQG